MSEPLPEPKVAPWPADANLDRVLVRGIAWAGGVKWLSQIITWTSTLLLARLLAPEDYGLVGMATVYLGLVALVNEFGLGTAIVTLHKLKGGQIAQINTVSLLLGITCLFVSVVAASPLAVFYRAPQLGLVVVVMSVGFVVTAFKTVPYALLQKELKFRNIAVVEGAQAIFQSCSTLILAWIGLRYWALVAGGLLGGAVSTAAILVMRRTPFARPRLLEVSEAVNFSRRILVARLSWFVYSNADFIVAGRVLGGAALGAYTFAWNLASLPIDKISMPVVQVIPAFFSALQDDRAALRRYLLKLTEGLALLTIPVALGLAIVAHEFVLVALGDKWREVVMPLSLLAVSAAFRSITPLFGIILNVVGETRFSMYNGLLAAFVLPSAFYVGSYWGTVGIAAGWLVALPLVSLPSYRRVFSILQLAPSDYLKSLWPMFSSAMVMAVTVLAIKLGPGASWSTPARLAAEVFGGASAYALTILVFHRNRLRTFLQVVRMLREKAA